MKDYVEEQNQDINTKDFELSHIIGLNTNIEKSIQAHPTMMDTIIYSVGGIIVVEDLNDRNNQVFFRHGRNQIGSFRISNNGQFLAVGFISDNLEKRIPTSVILWNFETKEVIYELTGIFKGVSVLEFSQDDQYLSGGGLDNSIFIWQIQTGYKCFHKVFEFNINLLQWTYIFMDKNSQNTIQNQNQIQGKTNTNPNTPQDPNIKKNINNINNNQKQSNTEYYLTIANVNVIHYLKFYYDFSTSQFFTNFSRFNLPSTGYNRIYSSSLCDLDNRVLYLGTSGGELSSFALDNLSFKESFNVINNGVTALLYMENMRSIIISGGDSRIKKMIFNEGKKILSHEIKLSGRVIALTKGPDEREFFAATKNGEIFRILVEDFTYTLHSISHVTPVNSCDFFRGRNDVCFISDETGNVLLWDLNEFNVILSLPQINPGEMATCVFIGEDNTIFIGYSNGILRNYIISDNLDNYLKSWEIPAHKGKVSSIYVDGNYIITGGEDGLIRIWTRKTHEMTLQISAHHSNVFKVFADLNHPNLIHSCGKDKNLNCYDIKTQKKATIQSLKNGFITGIAQKKTEPFEIVSVGNNCNLCIWDFSQREPMAEMSLNQNLNCIEISNSGKLAAIGNEFGEIIIFKLPEFEYIGRSIGHSKELSCLKWSPDDKQIISLSSDNSVCIWNIYRTLYEYQ